MSSTPDSDESAETPQDGDARPSHDGDGPRPDAVPAHGAAAPRGGGGGRGRRGGGRGQRNGGGRGPQGGGPRAPREGADAGPRPSLAPLAKLVAHLAKALVDRPDEVEVRESHERGPRIELLVAPDDIGKVIGKEGRTAQSIRALLLAAAARTNTRVQLDILD